MEQTEKHYHLLKYGSIFYRLTQAYFNERLKDTGIGAGQQYFLDRIARCPGIAVTKLAQTAVFDNGTSARAVKKLADEGYAVRTAAPELKAVATAVIGSNDEDAVARWLSEHAEIAGR